MSMASEAGVADHPTSSEEAQELHEEVKACKPEIISPAEVEKPELKDSVPVPGEPLPESEDQIEAKPIQAPRDEELKERDEEEKTKDEKLHTPMAPVVEEKIVIEPFVVEEELAQSLVTEEEKSATECPVVEEKISTQTPLVEDKLVQTPVVEEAKDAIEALAVEDKMSTETPVVEDKLVQTPAVEVADDTIEQLVVEEKNETETPVIEEAKITAEPPVVEEKIAIEPLPVEKILHTFAVKAAEETNEPLTTNEEILTEVGQEKLVQAPVVEETKVMTEQIIDEEKTATETSETEEENVRIEPPLMKEKFETEPPVEEKNAKILVVEETRNNAETPIVQEVKSTTGTPLVVEENYATGAPLVEEKIVPEPHAEEKIVTEPPVEEKIGENPLVEEVKNATNTPAVEENDAIEAPIAEEEKSVTEPPVVEAAKHMSESFVVEEVKKAVHTPDVIVSVKNESVVAQDCAAETAMPDASEPEAKIAETKPVTDNSESQEVEEAKLELVEDSEQELVKDVEIPEAQPIKEEVHETSTIAVDKPPEYVVVEAQKSVEVPEQDESTEQSSLEAISSGEALSPAKEDQPDAKEDQDEELPKQEAHTLMKVGAENELRDVKAEDSSQHETTEAEEVIKSISTTEVVENLMEGIISSRDAETVAENGNKDKKSESVTPVETCSNGTMQAKASEKPDDNKLDKPDAEEKEDDNVPAHETKDLDDKATLRDLPQEVVTVQSTQKQSKTILSKVKNTLVKAKKAITGKSNGKTPSFDPKGEIKV